MLAAQADAFAVARLQEAVELPGAGISEPVLMLEGGDELQCVSVLELPTMIHNQKQLQERSRQS